MLNVILLVVTMVVWTSIVLVYFRSELKAWFDNRYGPATLKDRPVRPDRRRMYD